MKKDSAYTATEGQVIFEVKQPYSPGTKTLLVWLNGLLCVEGKTADYSEVNDSAIEFNIPIKAGDKVTIVNVGLN